MAKYNISMTDLDTRHGITKLEHDGFSRETIMKTMYKKTEGMPQDKRQELVGKLFDRRER